MNKHSMGVDMGNYGSYSGVTLLGSSDMFSTPQVVLEIQQMVGKAQRKIQYCQNMFGSLYEYMSSDLKLKQTISTATDEQLAMLMVSEFNDLAKYAKLEWNKRNE